MPPVEGAPALWALDGLICGEDFLHADRAHIMPAGQDQGLVGLLLIQGIANLTMTNLQDLFLHFLDFLEYTITIITNIIEYSIIYTEISSEIISSSC